MSNTIQRTVYIENFGPISHAEVNLNKNFQIYIGAQASGKSTLCKVCYFCRKIRDYTLTFLLNRSQFEESHENEYFNNYLKFLTRQFMGCFGTTKHMRQFSIRYKFNQHVISIHIKNGYVRFSLDKELRESISNLMGIATKLYTEKIPKEVAEIFGLANFATIVKRSFVHSLQEIFMDKQEIIYVPAGRSLLAIIPEKLQEMPIDIIDLTMKEFIHKISDIKDRFTTKLPEMRDDYLKTIRGQINNVAVEKAYNLIKKIMKADYTSENDGEKIYFDETHWVKLMYSSSGQQESLWILLICYLYILENRSVFMIVEEPEAHLFPDAQKEIVNLISLLVNTTRSNIILTTHSPYILTSTNILLLANDIKNEATDSVVPRQYRLQWEYFYACYIESGLICSILDEAEKMINIEYIDRISGVTNDEMDRLLEMENE